MPTFLFDEHVFGPINSRRLGSSLGINLLSTEQKVCNFNCIYCECGLTYPLNKEEGVFVDKDQLYDLLSDKLNECISNGTPIDTITFAGNGEPTLHPHFLSVVKKVIWFRDKYYPKAKIAVLTNGYTLGKKRISQALSLVDKAIVKLDGGDDKMIDLIDRPKGNKKIEELIENIQAFQGRLIIQSMFLKGKVKGVFFDNSENIAVEKWINQVKSLSPSEVMIYSLERDTPLNDLSVISNAKLNQIADKVKTLGIKTSVV